MTLQKQRIKDVIKEFKDEIKDNRDDLKECIRARDYVAAAHLQSVNGALDYVIGILNHEINCDRI